MHTAEKLKILYGDASKATQILPGGVIDGEMLLRSGDFQYVKMNKRQPISISLVPTGRSEAAAPLAHSWERKATHRFELKQKQERQICHRQASRSDQST